ncbi:ORF6N domain-containing protein [Odoribacter sp. OttesenSCG-928-L07]|nr:ORF6N domain-containing protein [Odoribacter sp. OttesenSCG-928-L07]MDL2238767.1 ORF6N domain-containing protein [Bacteroidales bacterium OttesenSCG-928-L14]MDL2241188.1 ORF6N domain-containing protein [Bacteroidales bacterium OttesenSCG-928-K22]
MRQNVAEVGELYGIETKHINQAVKNNPDKFLEGYVIKLTREEKDEPVKIFDRFEKLKHSTVLNKSVSTLIIFFVNHIIPKQNFKHTFLPGHWRKIWRFFCKF